MKTKRLEAQSAAIAAILFLLHSYQSYRAGWDIRPMFRACFCLFYIPVVLTAGRKVIPYAFTLFALVIEFTTSFENYTPFVMILLAGVILPDKKAALIILYAATALAGMIADGSTISHAAIHFINCVCLWYAMRHLIQAKKGAVPLDLDESEKLILDELLEGKQQKEITLYSQNTITKKIKAARDRNNCRTTAELLMKYSAEKLI